MKSCCFAGHNEYISVSVKEELETQIKLLIEKHSVELFWIGNYGQFDYLVSEILSQVSKVYPNVKKELILPYTTKRIDINKENYKRIFDNIIIADIPETTPTKYKIIKTNQYMIDHCDYLICYVHHSWGGAAQTLEYAERKKKIKIIRI